jgi:O-methyltransferase involved in polyketide biosynthesis
VLERGSIFADPLAVRILSADAEAAIRDAENDPSGRMLRLFIAVRTRFAEDLGPALIRERYFANRGGPVPDRGGHIVRATTG